MPQLGQHIQGKRHGYTLDQVLVQGRFGNTYLATRDDDEQQQVILKTISLPQSPGWEAMELFERDGERLRQLDHPHTGRYLDSIVLNDVDGAHLGLVQSRVQGQSLQQRLRERGPSTVEDALRWFEPMLGTLTHMHELAQPLIHGDIDPGNIIIRDEDQQPVLVDFATARQTLLDAPRLASGLARGALDYAPMEQLLGLIFPASDLYALAMTFLSVVSGLKPAQFPIREGMRINVPEILGYGASDQLIILLKQMTEPDPAYRLDKARIALERVRALGHKGIEVTTPTAQPQTPQPPKRQSDTRRAPAPRQSPEQVMGALIRNITDDLDALALDQCFDAPDFSTLSRIHAFGANLDGTHLVAARGNEAYILEGADLGVRGELDFEEAAQRVAVSRDGKRIAILTGFERLLFYDVEISIWMRHEVRVEGMWPGNSQLTFSPKGDLVAISDDDQVNVYQWDDAKLVERYDLDGQFGLEFDPEGRYIFAVGAQGTTIIDGAQRHKLDLTGITFSPDGAMLAASKGNTVQFGAFHGLTPTLNWAHKDITIPEAAGLSLNLLAISPNQRYLAVASRDGFFRVIDMTQGRVLPFEDRRANMRDHVKLFFIGFSSTSEQLLVHATLPPSEVGHDEPIGVVTSYALPQGKLLGAMAFIDDELSLLAAQGFYGEVAELGSGSFSTHVWERPDLALDAFQGRDPERRLSKQERALLREYHQRRQGLKTLWELEERAWDLNAMIEATAGILHVIPEVWSRAQTQAERAQDRGYGLFEQTRQGYLLNAAQELRDMRAEDLRALHQQLLHAQGYQAPAHDEPHDPKQDSLYTAPEALKPKRQAGVDGWDDDLEEIRRRRAQDAQTIGRRSALSAPIPAQEESLTTPQDTTVAPSTGPSPQLMGLILSVCASLLLAIGGLMAFGFKQLPPATLLTVLIIAPIVGLMFYGLVVRRTLPS